MLQDKINTDLKTALKAKDTIKVSTLRMLLAGMQNIAIELRKEKLDDAEVTKVIQRQVRQHKESIEEFKKGNRSDLVEGESRELAILESYLPQAVSDAELQKIIKDTIVELGASTKKDMGKVMKLVMEKVQGRADGKKVSELVGQMLT